MTEHTDIRVSVRARYAAAAARSAAGEHDQARVIEASCCAGGAPVSTTDQRGQVVFGAELYDPVTAQGTPEAAVAASLGCGIPTVVEDLHPGETVPNLGSGAGADVLIAARRPAFLVDLQSFCFCSGLYFDAGICANYASCVQRDGGPFRLSRPPRQVTV
jgi:hypothetical protein